ncbi:MAG: histidine kinase [Verrucomicrobiota bacterium]
MRKLAVLATTLLGWLAAGCDRQGNSPADLSSAKLPDLEQLNSSITREVDSLASYTLRSGVGNLGHRSEAHEAASSTEWIRIKLEKETAFDQIILVPAIWRDTSIGFRAEGFPVKFRILAGREGDPGKEIARVDSPLGLLPRIAPFVIDVPRTNADWVSVEALELSTRAWDGKFVFQLSEVFVFDGEEPVSLHCEVTASSTSANEGRIRTPDNLVDGFVPYLMNSREGAPSMAMLSGIGIGARPYFTVDLGAVRPINRIHLHEIELRDNVPQTAADGLGLPSHLVIEGSKDADFKDPEVLVEYRMESPQNSGPIIMLRFPETECRYIRFVAEKPYINDWAATTGTQYGFAETEIFSGGINVALSAKVSGNFGMLSPDRSLSAVTDGRNLYGTILPTRQWLGELARRHDLAALHPLVAAELEDRYAKQKVKLRIMGWVAGLLAAGLIFTILVERIIRMRHIATLREKIAADLHDELGANLHTIGLLSDLAAESADDPEEMAKLHRRIRSETENSATAVRHCTDMISAKGMYIDFMGDMQRASRRIMARLDHHISVSGEELFAKLEPRTKAGLFLFYKECLVNISKHSGATEYRTHLAAEKNRVVMTISDNGRGLPGPDDSEIPASLRRRARLLGAKVTATSLPNEGTCIKLDLKTTLWRRLFRKIKP